MDSRWLVSALALAFALAGACSGEDPSAADGSPGPEAAACLELGLSEGDCHRWKGMILPEALPPARGNRFADDDSAAELGFELFFDLSALSPADVRCAACHAPEHGFSSNVDMPTGLGLVQRNALPLVNAARSHPHFWDGRADSLWSQSLSTIENDEEMGGSRLAVAHHVFDDYRAAYESTFGPMPDLSDPERFPPEGKPGSPAWEAMTEEDRALVTEVFVNVGKSFEAYLRKIASGRSRVDRFLLGERDALDDDEKAGLLSFNDAGCIRCHAGPSFSDGLYHFLDVPLPIDPEHRAASLADRGRAQGLEVLLASEFNGLSPYFDRPAGETPVLEEATDQVAEGLFLTPSLRNVSTSKPYGHNGVWRSLDEVVRFHLQGGGPQCSELEPRALGDDEIAHVVAFLEALEGDAAPRPWSFWPSIGGGGGEYPNGGD